MVDKPIDLDQYPRYMENGRVITPITEYPPHIQQYYRHLRILKRHPEWKDLSYDEIMELQSMHRNEVARENLKKSHDKYNSISDEEKTAWNKKKNTYNLLDERAKRERIRLLNEGNTRWWNSLSEEEKKEFANKRWENNNCKEKIIETLKKSFEEYNNSLTKEDIMDRIQYMNKLRKEKMDNDEEFKKMMLDELSRARAIRVSNLTEEDRKRIGEQARMYWANMSHEERLRRSLISTARNKKWWASRTPNQLKEISIKMRNFNNNISDETRRWIILKAQGHNKLHQRFEEIFQSIENLNDFNFQSEIHMSNNKISHYWDYGIFDVNNNLVAVVDLDGDYYHADNCDYDGIHSRIEYDSIRGYSVPEGIKRFIIRDKCFMVDFQWFMNNIILSYLEWENNTVEHLASMPLPIPQYRDKELINSWNQLQRMDPHNKYYKKWINSRLGDRIIHHFNPLLWKDIKWDKEHIREWVHDGTIYQCHLNKNKVLQNLTPYFVSAGNIKLLLSNENDSEYVFDMEGNAGLLLGSISLGKYYIGPINENNGAMLDFLYKYNIKFNVINTIDNLHH